MRAKESLHLQTKKAGRIYINSRPVFFIINGEAAPRYRLFSGTVSTVQHLIVPDAHPCRLLSFDLASVYRRHLTDQGRKNEA